MLSDGIGTSIGDGRCGGKGGGEGRVRGMDELSVDGKRELVDEWIHDSDVPGGGTGPFTCTCTFTCKQSAACSSTISPVCVCASSSEFRLSTRASITSNASTMQPLCFSKQAKNGSSHIGKE